MNCKPYIGLRSFNRNDRHLFFGREQHSNELIERLNRQHFLAVVGDSGCGKSSLVKAGLIPGLQSGFLAEAGSHWRIAETRPGNEPLANLVKALLQDTALGPDYETALTQNDNALLSSSPFSLHELLTVKPLPNHAKLLIVCDQFEELFRYSQQQLNLEEAAAFAAFLLASANPYPLAGGGLSDSIYVIVTMRSDYLGQCAQFPGLAEAINQGLYLTPRLNRQQLRAAIEKPALVCGGKVEPALLVRLLSETGNDPDQLPLLQHLLMRLWDIHCRDGKNNETADFITIGVADYDRDDIKSLKNALSVHADEAYNELSEAQKTIARQIFCRLTGAESGKNDTRNPTKVSELMALTGQTLEAIASVLKVFRQAGRCFVLPPEGEALFADTVVDITHESLIRNWTRLEEWAKEEAEAASIYRRLEQNALLHFKEAFGLYRSPELEATLKWRDENQPTANWAKRYGKRFRLAMAFLQRSLREQQAEHERERLARQREIEREQAEQEKERLAQQREMERQQAEQERERQREVEKAKQKQLFLLLVLLVAAGFTAWALKERHHVNVTEKQRTVDLFQSRLTHASLLAKGEDYLGAKQVLKETDALENEVSPAMLHSRNLLRSFAEIMGGEAEQVYQGAGYPLYTTAVSPDGQLLAAGGEHGTLVIFDVASGKLLQRLEGHATEGVTRLSSVKSIAFTHKGDTLISAGDDKKIIIWQRQGQSFKQQKVLAAPDEVGAIAISPDGKLLASGGGDNAISLWELPGGKLLNSLKRHRERISDIGLAFSADGRTLASVSYDDTAIIWEVASGKPLHTLSGHNGDVYHLAFSPDGQTLATAGEDKIVRLWNVASGKLQRSLVGHSNMVFAVQFIGNGDTLLSAGFDRTIRLWDTQSGVTLRILQGHDSNVLHAVVYGDRMFSTSNDGTERGWRLGLPYQQRVALPSEPASNAISPNLKNVAVGFKDGALAVYGVNKGSILWNKESAHDDQVLRLVFNNNGDLLASSSHDNTAKIWKVASPTSLEELQTYNEHEDSVYAVSFSPDSQILATASFDGNIGLFKLGSNEKPGFIEKAHDGEDVNAVSFSHDGKQLLSNSDYNIKLWNIQTSTPTSQTLPKANDTLMWSSWSPDNQTIAAVGRANLVNIYNITSRSATYHFTGHENTVYKAIFSSDNQQLATVSMDTTLKMWEFGQGKELFTIHLPTEFSNPSAVWDFDFRCQAANCVMAVPLVRGLLQLYQFSYEGKPQFDAQAEKRALIPLWQSYLDTVQIYLNQHALQPALQTLREIEQIASHYPASFANDAEYEALKKQGACLQQKTQQLENGKNALLDAECEMALNKAISSDELNSLGVGLYKQKRYGEARNAFAKALEKFPEDFQLLSSDAELALVQGDRLRMQQRLQTMRPLYVQKDGIYSDLYPAIMQFLLFLSDDQLTIMKLLHRPGK